MCMPFTEVSEGLFCMICTPVMLNGNKSIFFVALNDVLLMFVVHWILLKYFEYMDGRVTRHSSLFDMTSLYKLPVKCMDWGIQ